MKKHILPLTPVTLIIAITIALCWNIDSAMAKNQSNNTRYEMLHIKQMAQRKSSSNSRVKYVYQDTSTRKQSDKPGEIGTTRLDNNRNVRELHIAVDMRYNYRLNRVDSTGKTSIGKITGNSRSLKKVNLVIHSNKPLKFDR